MTDDPADLAHLHGIAVPSPVPWWPPAAGWWVLAAALLAVAVVIAMRRLHRWRADAYRRAALRDLMAIEAAAGLKNVEAAAALSAVLKRAALVAFPRTDCAALTGAAWLEFLDRTGSGSTFSTGPARLLPQLACGGPADREALPAALAEARRWIATHRAARPC
jgi:hypothetical protein